MPPDTTHTPRFDNRPIASPFGRHGSSQATPSKPGTPKLSPLRGTGHLPQNKRPICDARLTTPLADVARRLRLAPAEISVACVDDLAGEVDQLDVALLRKMAQHLEGLYVVDFETLHDDALGLPDAITGR
jgi:hypothetical protein